MDNNSVHGHFMVLAIAYVHGQLCGTKFPSLPKFFDWLPFPQNSAFLSSGSSPLNPPYCSATDIEKRKTKEEQICRQKKTKP